MERLPYLLTVVLTILILLFFNSISQAQTSFNVSNKTTGDTLLTIDNDGDVGIGTTTPAVKFDLRSEITDDHARLWLGNSDLSHFLRFFSGRQNSPNPGIFWNQTDALRFGTSLSGFTEYMRITNNGYVGIGTTSPTEMLEVADTIYSTIGGFKFPDGSVQETAASGGGVISIDSLTDGSTIGLSVFLGSGAGSNDDGSTNRNTATGYDALYTNTTGFNNTANGYNALYANTTGSSNVSSGHSALYANTTGAFNVGIGMSANRLNQSGLRNTIIGYEAGRGSALHSKSGNVFLGYQAGYNEPGDNKLYIENSDNSTPLIWGDFSSDSMRVHGDLHVTGDFYIDGSQNTTGDGGFLSGGTFGFGTIPIESEGTRMMWYPGKAAFRVGRVYSDGSDFWDDDSIGLYSFASGFNTRASNGVSTAMGNGTSASGGYSTAMGAGTRASGQTATAMGANTTATGSASTAMGASTTASGNQSTAMGLNTEASGASSTAMGNNSRASGNYSTAIGYGSLASGDYSTAMGRATEASGEYSMALGFGIEAAGSHAIAIALSNQNGVIVSQDSTMAIMGGKVGINENNPNSDLQVGGTNGVLFTGTYGSGTIPVEGAGTRLMWYPAKGAFRAGRVDADGSTNWNDINIGGYSMAAGYNTTARGGSAIALGFHTSASNNYSTALGYYTSAGGEAATAMGYNTEASGDYSTAIGRDTDASGRGAIAMGSTTTASGEYSTATGSNTIASGDYSTATGDSTTASGEYSTAMGKNIGTTGDGSFVIGDGSPFSHPTFTESNRFTARFHHGYYLYTSRDLSSGARLYAGDFSWSAMSDSTKKENFKSINGEDFLNKISNFNLTSWNYKGQDPTQSRHYGPMAQDFYAAFGNDGVGTIGNDTTIASADFDGVNFIAIQALEKRTAQLKEKINEISDLKKDNQQLKEELALLKTKIEKFESLFSKVEELTKPNNNQYAKIKDNLK